jgi:hypothetical protein
MMLLCTLPVYIVILFINEIITYKKKKKSFIRGAEDLASDLIPI